MADPRVFISFDYDNNKELKVLFSGQTRNSRTPFNIEDWSSKDVLPQSEWEALIHSKINCCNMLIVLVGKYTASATAVIKEIRFAAKINVPVYLKLYPYINMPAYMLETKYIWLNPLIHIL